MAKLKFVLSIIFLSVMILQFNNCASGVQDTSTDSSLSDSQSTSPSLELRFNTKSQTRFMSPGFNAGGDCNMGGFDNVRIEWELKSSSTSVVHSKSSSLETGANCVNGTFSVRVLTHNQGTPIGQTPKEDCPLTLYARIYGSNQSTGEIQEGIGDSVQVYFDNDGTNGTCSN
ncbi:MAG: hypothetical protein KDD50_01540 [Bdellovibrionales bacterium]|nr:hypothetical protein [Bdellovibrionales bacterium]